MLSILLAIAPLTAVSDREPAEAAVSLARQELGARLGVGTEEIELVEAAPVRWKDESPSCEPGAASPSETPANGYRVRLRVEGGLYRVHVGAGRAIVCGEGLRLARALSPEGAEGGTQEDRPAIPLPTAESQRRLVEQAKADLSRRLSRPAGEIELVEFQQVMWRDASLGCPRPGMMYAQVIREGYRIGLRAGKRIFQYHSGGGTPFLCEAPPPD